MEAWSIWLLSGVICIGLELVVPGLVIIFFGLGAIRTAVFAFIIPDAVWLQVLVFIICSILSLVFLRKKFTAIFKGSLFYPDKKSDNPASDFAEVIEPISENKEGRIKYGGTTWNAVSVSGEIETGSSVKIIKREGLTYLVEKINDK